jgi:hypothetical protein
MTMDFQLHCDFLCGLSNSATHRTAPTAAADASASQDGRETKSVKAISHYCMCVLLSASAMQPAFSRVVLLLVAISALACHAAHALRAPPHSIECASPSRVSGCAYILSFSIFLFVLCVKRYSRFSAGIDYSGFQPGSGYFNLVNASIRDNYNGLGK